MKRLAKSTGLHPLLTQVLINRGISTAKAASAFLNPQKGNLPAPAEEFPDLVAARSRLTRAIREAEKIAICGDYDADGMTSTALFLRTFRTLGAQADFAIPSRMTEGYGINERIVSDLHAAGVSVLVTVDNGIAAVAPIALAKELGISVIVTDHHDIPPELPPADAILNPKLIRPTSPYCSVAGVGVAYMLALELAAEFGKQDELASPLLELLTLGTIADLAALTGINRRWVKAGLALLPDSQIPGVRALMQVAGLSQRDRALKPEAIGFGLGPRINAVGRLAQPEVVIDLLSTDDEGVALERAMQCEQINQSRQQLCREIEIEAIAQFENSAIDLREDRVLVLLGEEWHHGVIGIVASRLLERYGAPVFIGAREGHSIRGSARGIPGFNVFEALQACADAFEKFGGHPAAGGFSMAAERWPDMHRQLRDYARSVLNADQMQPLIAVDVEATLSELDTTLFEQMQQLQPFGMDNREPVFWSRNVCIGQQRPIGKDKAHLKLQVSTPDATQPKQAIAWRAGEWHPLPEYVDIAYCLRENEWLGEVAIELEIKGIRAAEVRTSDISATDSSSETASRKTLTRTRAAQPKRSNDKRSSSDRPRSAELPPFVNTALTSSEPELIYAVAPDISHSLQWHDLSSFSTLLPKCRGTALLYGCRRPQIMTGKKLTVHYDRPQANTQYDYIWLWSLPPSLTHLRWLLATATPAHPEGHRIYLHKQVVPLPN
ncbi:MAG: single-stranded-DNA-specific exonuclease RecJ, partial [Cyanobacteria bacterium P01_E01_bin.48]